MHNTEIDLSGDQFVRYMFTDNGSLSNLTPFQKTQTRHTSSIPKTAYL